MLRLQRKIGESILLILPDGRSIEVRFLGHAMGHRDHVRLGIKADRAIPVRRSEIPATVKCLQPHSPGEPS